MKSKHWSENELVNEIQTTMRLKKRLELFYLLNNSQNLPFKNRLFM